MSGKTGVCRIAAPRHGRARLGHLPRAADARIKSAHDACWLICRHAGLDVAIPLHASQRVWPVVEKNPNCSRFVTIIWMTKQRNKDKGQPRKAAVQITPAMIDAGVLALAYISVGADPAEMAREVCDDVFRAMVQASDCLELAEDLSPTSQQA